jgi:hypothetical protein
MYFWRLWIVVREQVIDDGKHRLTGIGVVTAFSIPKSESHSIQRPPLIVGGVFHGMRIYLDTIDDGRRRGGYRGRNLKSSKAGSRERGVLDGKGTVGFTGNFVMTQIDRS